MPSAFAQLTRLLLASRRQPDIEPAGCEPSLVVEARRMRLEDDDWRSAGWHGPDSPLLRLSGKPAEKLWQMR